MFFDDLPPERREELEAELAAQRARDAVPTEFEQKGDGTWIARKLGCVGVGESQLSAGFDLTQKLGLAFGPAWRRTEEFRQGQEAIRPAVERILKKFGGS